MSGYFALVLHSHLPFVKHPDHDYFLEEHWLFEAIIESYLPLLSYLERLQSEQTKVKITISLTPTLCEMLSDSHLNEKFGVHLDNLIALSQKECERLQNDPVYYDVAHFYLDRLQGLKAFFQNSLNSCVLNGYKRFRDAGMIEIITCGATHGFLPLLSENLQAVRVQIEAAIKTHQKHFGAKPKGIWLPECAYFEGLDSILKEYELEFFFLESHGLVYARPTPRFGVYAPAFTPEGVAAFARDPESSRQVWSSISGYPGDTDYRDFYRDIGYDLDYEYIKPHILPDGTRTFTGLKYHKITGDSEYKEVYNRHNAFYKARDHAYDFVAKRKAQIANISQYMDREPLIVSPYDAELFGHWWFEGPDFIYHLFKALENEPDVTPITPPEYLAKYPTNQMVHPTPSSWGRDGYYDVWINPQNDWIYRHLHHMADTMCELANRYKEAPPLTRRILNQMNKETLLAQASDWAFLITTATATDYSTRRTKEHIGNFLKLEAMLDSDSNISFLESCEKQNSLFEGIEYTIWQTNS